MNESKVIIISNKDPMEINVVAKYDFKMKVHRITVKLVKKITAKTEKIQDKKE